MYTLYLLTESITNGFKFELLNLISLFSIFCGLLVISVKNPVVSVLFLIGLFASISGYLVIIGINFLGLSYLLVYVGAVSILFLFILMLINVRISELLSDSSNSIPLALLVSLFLSISLVVLYPNSMVPNSEIQENTNSSLFNINILLENIKNIFISNNGIYYTTSKTWDGNLAESAHITTIGNILYTNYSIWLIITSIILLLAMVGAIVITVNQNKK